LFCGLLFISAAAMASDVWSSPAFSASPEAVRQAAAEMKPAKDTPATILLNEERYAFDADGRRVDTFRRIYRIESEEGVKGWAETSGRWEPWRQARPEIKARVITADGSVHLLDAKTLNDVPIHEEDPDLYSDRRAYGGPLPAVAVGAIVEEEVTTRDTAPYFPGGVVERSILAFNVPVHRSRIVLSHPESLPLRYVLKLLPDATVRKSNENGRETVTIENGLLPPHPKDMSYLPADVVPYPEVEFGTGTSWQRVAQEYSRMANEKLRLADVQPLVAKVNTKGAIRAEIISRLVGVLHKSVRYTGVEFGESGLVPQFPVETLKRKYGDCKDKATLLAAMLRAAAVPASLALLDTGPGQDVDIELPGMGLFDHAIVYVPPSGEDGELWIDATDTYARPGDLPFMDYGRWALIVDEHTTALKKIPEITAEQNFHREVREFSLNEFGVADIVERNEQRGPKESEYREFYGDDAKKARDEGEKYVKREYLADSLISLTHSDVADMGKPFSVTYVTKGRRGSTNYESATMAIRIEDLFYGLPDHFTSADDEGKDTDEERGERDQPRIGDWQIYPFVNEWDYKITAPPGFKLRALPAARESQLGTAKFTQNYSVNPEGRVVEAVLRFESGKPRLTVAEAKALRDAVVQAEKSDPVLITFDQTGHSLMGAGKIKEGLAAYHDLVKLHPKEALHRIQLARALLEAGLAEKARSVAKEATALDPSSANALRTLGWILEHDLVGRRFKKGFEYDGAVAAYRKAKALDPKDKDLRADLAILLESDADGLRYTEKAHLPAAIAEFKELKQLDKEYMLRFEDNILFDLWYSHDYKGLLEAEADLPTTDERKGLLLAAIAAGQGVEAAIKKSLEITTEEHSRSQALLNAGGLLIRVRKYPEAAALFMAGSHGQPNGSQLAASAAIFEKTKPHQQAGFDPADPRSVLQRMFVLFLTANAKPADFQPLFAKSAKSALDDQTTLQRARSQMRVQIGAKGLPIETVLDLVLSNLRFSLEGDDNLGYKITLEALGAAAQEAYVVREDGQWKVAAFSSGSSGAPDLAWQVLALLQKRDLEHARRWLDWAREKIHISEGDDSLSGQPFPYFWTKGQEGDEAAIRAAALVLLPSKELKDEYLSGLILARETARSDDDRRRLNLVLAHAYAAQERWTELLDVAEKLMASAPDSYLAFNFAGQAYVGLKRLDDWNNLLQSRLQKHRDDPEYIRSASRLAIYQHEFEKARGLIKTLMDRGKATENDMNSYAWSALLVPPPDQDAIDAARRANDLTKNSNFAILHTLACLEAETGHTSQARELLLKAMDAADMEEPNSQVWFGFGKIAEQFGESDAAISMYGRVEKVDPYDPGTSYALALQRLQALRPANAAAKNTRN
jgi:transglutaminase-like putative cysteine protease/tetratricopeptide (TPR) repeat protein